MKEGFLAVFVQKAYSPFDFLLNMKGPEGSEGFLALSDKNFQKTRFFLVAIAFVSGWCNVV
jgi:hypothetical protein